MNEKMISNLSIQSGMNNRYQYLSLLIIFFLNGTTEFLAISLPFLESKPLVSFKDDLNSTHVKHINYTICENYTFEIVKNYSSIVNEFEIYCDRTKTSILGLSLFTGILLGSLVSYLFIDRFGRKKCTFIFSNFYIVIIILFSFVNNIYIIFGLTFISGFLYIIVALSFIILLNEIISGNLVAMFTTIIFIAFFLFGLVYTYIFYELDDWRLIFRIVGALQLISTLVFYLYMEESPRFYIAKKDYNNFLLTIKNIANKNNLKLNEEEITSFNSFYIEENRESLTIYTEGNYKNEFPNNQTRNLHDYSLLDLLKYPSQRYNFLILCYLWLITSLIFYGLSINMKNISGNIYQNLIIIYSLDIAFCFITGLISNNKSLGRKNIIILILLISFVVCMVSLFADENFKDIIFTYTILISQICFTCLLCIQFFLTNEIYPTVIRAKGLGYNSACGRIGSMISPFIIENLDIDSMILLFLILSLMGIMFSFFLPETAGKSLQNSIPEEDGSLVEYNLN